MSGWAREMATARGAGRSPDTSGCKLASGHRTRLIGGLNPLPMQKAAERRLSRSLGKCVRLHDRLVHARPKQAIAQGDAPG